MRWLRSLCLSVRLFVQLGSCMLPGSVPCNKGAGDVVAACVAVVVDQFSAEIKSPRQLAFHRLRIDFLHGYAPASDKGFIQRMRAVHFEGEIFTKVGESLDS